MRYRLYVGTLEADGGLKGCLQVGIPWGSGSEKPYLDKQPDYFQRAMDGGDLSAGVNIAAISDIRGQDLMMHTKEFTYHYPIFTPQ